MPRRAATPGPPERSLETSRPKSPLPPFSNQDFGGIDGNDNTIDLSHPWNDLGGMDSAFTPSGNPVPEPSLPALLAGLAFVGLLRRRNRASGK
jgi:hypothetical protein